MMNPVKYFKIWERNDEIEEGLAMVIVSNLPVSALGKLFL